MQNESTAFAAHVVYSKVWQFLVVNLMLRMICDFFKIKISLS